MEVEKDEEESNKNSGERMRLDCNSAEPLEAWTFPVDDLHFSRNRRPFGERASISLALIKFKPK